MSIREIVERWKNGPAMSWEQMIVELEAGLKDSDDELKKELSKPPGLILMEFLNASDGNSEGAMSALSTVHYALMQRAQLRIIELLEELKSRPVSMALDFAKPGSEFSDVICASCNHAYTIPPGGVVAGVCPGCGR